jgi:hypothetical protein
MKLFPKCFIFAFQQPDLSAAKKRKEKHPLFTMLSGNGEGEKKAKSEMK